MKPETQPLGQVNPRAGFDNYGCKTQEIWVCALVTPKLLGWGALFQPQVFGVWEGDVWPKLIIITTTTTTTTTTVTVIDFTLQICFFNSNNIFYKFIDIIIFKILIIILNSPDLSSYNIYNTNNTILILILLIIIQIILFIIQIIIFLILILLIIIKIMIIFKTWIILFFILILLIIVQTYYLLHK